MVDRPVISSISKASRRCLLSKKNVALKGLIILWSLQFPKLVGVACSQNVVDRHFPHFISPENVDRHIDLFHFQASMRCLLSKKYI